MIIATIAVPGYRLDRMLGRGGFGIVWLATRESDGYRVAVKVLHRVLDGPAATRFNDEIQTMGTLAWHPNIARIIDAGVTGPVGDDSHGQVFIVMEYLPGGSLGQRLAQFGAAPPPDVIAAGVQAATGLQVAHNAGVLHRDIKPDNLLVGEGETVKVSDFGIAVATAGADGTRGATGTLAYSAPELLGGGVASPASDVYALGATLYALLTGEAAFHRKTDESPAALILRAYTQPVPDLGDRGVPGPLAHVVERAMAKQPADRPASAEALARELVGAAHQLGLPVPTVVPAGQARPPAGSHQSFRPPPQERAKAQRLTRLTRRVGGVAMALIAVAFIGVSTFTGQSDDATTAPAEDAAIEEPAADQAAEDEGSDDEGSDDEGSADDAPAEEPAPADPPPADPPPAVQPTELDDDGDVAAFAVPITPTIVAADGEQRYAADGQQLIALDDASGESVAAIDLPGIVDLATIDGGAGGSQLVALLDDDTIALLTADLRRTGPELRGAAIATERSSLLIAGEDGVTRVTGDGQQEVIADVSAVSVDIRSGIIWIEPAAGGVLALDPSGAVLVELPGLIEFGDLAAAPDRTALTVTAEGVVRIGLDGVVTPLSPVLPSQIAVTPDGTALGLIGSEVGVIGPGELFAPIRLAGPAVSLASGDRGAVVGLANPTAVVRPGE